MACGGPLVARAGPNSCSNGPVDGTSLVFRALTRRGRCPLAATKTYRVLPTTVSVQGDETLDSRSHLLRTVQPDVYCSAGCGFLLCSPGYSLRTLGSVCAAAPWCSSARRRSSLPAVTPCCFLRPGVLSGMRRIPSVAFFPAIDLGQPSATSERGLFATYPCNLTAHALSRASSATQVQCS